MRTDFPRNRKTRQKNISSNPLFWFVLLLMLLTLIRAMPAMAFREKPKRDPEQMVATLQERLNLTDGQVEQIRPILYDQSENRRGLFEKYRPQGRQGRSAMRSEMQELRSETDARWAEVLSDEQMQAYREGQNQKRQRMNQRFRSRDSRPFE